MKARRSPSRALVPAPKPARPLPTQPSIPLPEKKTAGWTGAVRSKRVKNVLNNLAKIEFDTMDLSTEANLLRALTIDYINRYEQFTEALLAWYADPETHVKPRRIMDITDAAGLVESISRIVQRMHSIQSEGSISMETFKRVTEGNEDPAHNGKYIFDRITLQKNDGTINPVALSQIKAYGVAILGEEAANNPEGLNTDDFKGARVMVVVGIQTYQRKNADGSPMMQDGAPVTGQSNEVKRILAAG